MLIGAMVIIAVAICAWLIFLAMIFVIYLSDLDHRREQAFGQNRYAGKKSCQNIYLVGEDGIVKKYLLDVRCRYFDRLCVGYAYEMVTDEVLERVSGYPILLADEPIKDQFASMAEDLSEKLACQWISETAIISDDNHLTFWPENLKSPH